MPKKDVILPEEEPAVLPEPPVFPQADYVFDVGKATMWLRYAYERLVNQFHSILIQEDAVEQPAQRELLVMLARNALVPGGTLYLPATWDKALVSLVDGEKFVEFFDPKTIVGE